MDYYSNDAGNGVYCVLKHNIYPQKIDLCYINSRDRPMYIIS